MHHLKQNTNNIIFYWKLLTLTQTSPTSLFQRRNKNQERTSTASLLPSLMINDFSNLSLRELGDKSKNRSEKVFRFQNIPFITLV